MVNKNVEKCSKIITHQEKEMKIIMRCYSPPEQVTIRELCVQLSQSCKLLLCAFDAAQGEWGCVFIICGCPPASPHPHFFLGLFLHLVTLPTPCHGLPHHLYMMRAHLSPGLWKGARSKHSEQVVKLGMARRPAYQRGSVLGAACS